MIDDCQTEISKWLSSLISRSWTAKLLEQISLKAIGRLSW